jgi:hypothetical protein
MANKQIEPIAVPGPSPGWGADLVAAICEQCDWRYLLPADSPLMNCPHCFQVTLTSLGLSEAGGTADSWFDHPPEMVLPFSASPEIISRTIQQFGGKIWFAPGDLTPRNLQARLQRTYLPMWLVDSQVEAEWQAEAGFDYQAVSHRDTFDENRRGWYSEQITETRIRWEARVGHLKRHFHNIPAPALEEHFELSRKLGHFDLEAGQTYASQALGQALVRLPNRSPADAWPDTVPAFQAAAGEECRLACDADHMRDFRWAARYEQQNWTLLLLPLYTTYYLDDDNQPQTILIHGQTGRLSGRRRASMKRAQRAALTIVAVAAVIFVLSLIVAAISFFVPPLIIVATLGIILALAVGMLAIAPVVIAWQTNRSM